MGNQAILWHYYSAANNGGFGVALTITLVVKKSFVRNIDFFDRVIIFLQLFYITFEKRIN